MRPDIEILKTQAEERVRANDYGNAFELYNKILLLDPSLKEIHCAKGNVLRCLNCENALKAYDAALKLDPDYIEALSGKAHALRESGYFEEALLVFDRLLTLDPSQQKIYHYNKGLCFVGLDLPAEALAAYDKALSFDSSYADALKAKAQLEELKAYMLALSTEVDAKTGSALKPIPPKELKLSEEILGRGGFAFVQKARWRGTEVAVKKPKTTGQLALLEFEEEARLHADLDHPNIVSLHGVCVGTLRFVMVMELMPCGSLFDLLHTATTLPWSIRNSIAMDIAAALSYLHAKGIVYCDMKSSNVLIGDHMRAKLSDLGLAFNEKTSTGIGRGTPLYMSPELLSDEKAPNTRASDIYGMGIVLYELLTRLHPFSKMIEDKGVAAFKKLICSGIRDSLPSEQPKFATLISKCWALRAADRPSSAQLVLDELRSMDKTEAMPAAAMGGAGTC